MTRAERRAWIEQNLRDGRPCGHPWTTTLWHTLSRSQAVRAMDEGAPCQLCGHEEGIAAAGGLSAWRGQQRRAQLEQERERQEREDRRSRQQAREREAWQLDGLPRRRQWIFRRLRGLGCQREHTSGSGSVYYRHPCGTQVRVADHAVPLTPARDAAAASWANGRGHDFVLEPDVTTMDYLRLLVEVRAEIRRRTT